MKRDNKEKAVHILLVEDDKGHAKLISRAFISSEAGYRVDIAGNLEEARSYLSAAQPDLVITDINLPDGKGTELLDMDPEEQQYPLVVMTSYGDEQLAVDIIKAGAMDYIVKMDSTFRDMPNIARRIMREWRYINGRKHAEKALKESEKKYRMLFNSMMDAFAFHEAVYDDNGQFVDYKYVEINTMYEKFIGLKRDEVIGRTVKELFPDQGRQWIDIYAKVMESCEPVQYEYYLEITGSYYEVNAYQPEPDTFATVLSDISMRKKAELEKQELEEKLGNLEKMEAIGRLAGGVAHDLNNVLSAIVSYPDLLLMKLPEDSKLKKPILTMQQSGQKAAAIVQDMLTLARRGVAVKEIVDLRDVLTNYLLSPEYEKVKKYHTGLEIETDFGTDLLNVEGSFIHLSKSVMNLVSNAAEAMPDGGKISISLQNRYVDRESKGYDLTIKEGDYIVLTVIDNGIGISKKDLKKIFEPFYTKKEMGRSGTGLGMTVVWGTVKDHGGYIAVNSSEDKGTCFELYFPATRKMASSPKTDVLIEDYIGSGEKILIIDDVREQREIASALLTTLGYNVETVASGEDAITYMKNGSADLILLDMIMDHGIDGLDTYKGIIKYAPHIKTVIASGYSETDRVREAQKLGAGAYIKKPYTLEKIGIAIKAEFNK